MSSMPNARRGPRGPERYQRRGHFERWRGYPRKVVRVFGGDGRGAVPRMAKLTGIGPSTIYWWLCSGVIGARMQARLFALARRHGLPLRPEHFFDLPEDEEQAA